MGLRKSLLQIWLAALLVGVVSAQVTQPVKILAPFTITPIDIFRAYLLQPGSVYGARDCGGSGRTVQATHDHCSTGFPATCGTIVNRPARNEVYFIPNENLSDLLLRISVIVQNGERTSFDVPMPGTTLIAGQPYLFSTVAAPTSELLGKFITAKLEILDKNNMSLHVCAEADYFVYSEQIAQK